MPDYRCQTSDARRQMPDVRYQIPDARRQMPDARQIFYEWIWNFEMFILILETRLKDIYIF